MYSFKLAFGCQEYFFTLYESLRPPSRRNLLNFENPSFLKCRLAIFLYYITRDAISLAISNQFTCGKVRFAGSFSILQGPTPFDEEVYPLFNYRGSYALNTVDENKNS